MKRQVFVCAIIIGLFNLANAQWQHTNGPYGGNIVQMANDTINHIIYAVSYGNGVFSTSNNGNSWTHADYGLPEWNSSCAVNGSTVFVGTGDAGVYFSPNHGVNWFASNNGIASQGVNTFACSGNNMFIGTWSGSVFLSTDNGATWTAMNNGLTTSQAIFSLGAEGNTIVAGSFGEVFLSTNNATSWTHVFTCSSAITSIIFKDGKIFVGSGGPGIFMSADTGSTWTAVNTGLMNTDVHALAVRDTVIFAGTDEGVYTSTNDGQTWSAANNGISFLHVLSLVVSDSIIFAGTSAEGVFKSVNNGASWIPANNNLATRVTSLTECNNKIFAGTFGGSVFRTSDNGTNWVGANNGLTASISVCSMASHGNYVFAGTRIDGFFLSLDDGNHWMAANNGLPLVKPDILSIAVKDTNIVAASAGMFLTTDNASNWTAISNGLPTSTLNQVAFHGNDLFTVTYGDGIYLSTNFGLTWTAKNNGITHPDLYSIAFLGNKIFVGGGGGIYISSNNGNSWTYNFNNGLAYPWVHTMAVVGRNIFAGTEDCIDLSTDKGQHFYHVSTGMPASTVVYSTLVKDTMLYLATSKGVWKRSYLEMLRPVITSQPSDRSVCSGDNITFTVVARGDSLSYQWRHNGTDIAGAIAGTFNIPYCTPQDTGSYTCYLSNIYGNLISHAAHLALNPAPDSSFTYTVNGSTVGFNTQPQTSAGYYWDFGDGNNSNQGSPSHTYLNGGYYQACLTVIDTNSGCQNINCSNLQIGNLSNACDAHFNYSVNTNLVTFTDLSAGNPSNWFWDFGDASIAADQNPVHSYNSGGTYAVHLSVFNQSTQCMDSYEEEVNVGATSSNCHAAFNFFPDILTNTVYLQDQSTGSITNYLWNFGDGNYSTDQSPIHQYANAETYTVCLSVWDSIGLSSDILCQDVVIGYDAAACTAGFIYTVDTLSNMVSLHDESTGDPATWNWDFGDNTQSVLQNPDHTYGTSGYYTVHLQIVTQQSCVKHHVEVINVNANSGLHCSFVPVVDMGGKTSHIPVNFYGAVFGHARKIKWDFGDSSPKDSTTLAPLHEYQAYGVYNVTLHVEDPEAGATDNFSYVLHLDTANFIAEVYAGYDGFEIYPNPAHVSISIMSTFPKNQISIYNLQGQLLLKQLLEQQMTEVDISDFAKGMYFITVQTKNRIVTKKFIKE